MRDELGIKMHYLAIYYVHPYPTQGGLIKFKITNFDASYSSETVSNIRIDPENL
jgi:hypothetical protein